MRIILLLFTLLLVGCGKKLTSIQGVAHTHPYHLQVGHSLSEKEKKEISDLITAVFIEIDEIYNHTESNKTGLFICPQFMIDKYSVDFLLIYNNHVSNNKIMLIVECDSQQWHDRSEKERRYEKIRERYIVSKGYKIFHFTGKEITDNPFKVAIEILNYLTNNEIEEVDYYEEFTDKGSNNG